MYTLINWLRKRINTNKETKSDKVKNTKKAKFYRPKYKVPADVRLHWIMPIIFAVSVLLILISGIKIHKNIAVYKAKVLASSMSYGSELPLWGGTTNAKLTLGNTVLSKDGKTLAVEVKYDDIARNTLSSFGKNYRLRLVVTDKNKMPDAVIKYGMFSTDGSGVLTVHSKHGFKNQAFIVMLVDRGYLVSTNALTTDGDTYTDDDLDKSITAQLADADANDNSSSSKKDDKNVPPIFYMRLNAHNARRSKTNWSNDREIVRSLFIDRNIKEKQKDINKNLKKIEQGNNTIKEMEQRLKENPDNQTAQKQLPILKNSVSTLQAAVDSQQKSVDKLKNSVIRKNILEPKETTYKRYLVDTLDIKRR